MKTLRLLPALFLLSLPGLWGCGAEPDAPAHAAPDEIRRQDAAERQAVLTALQSLRQSALREAFAALPRYRYTRRTRTEQFDAAERPLAFVERLTRNDVPGGPRTVLEADSAGAFAFGYLRPFLPAKADERDAADLPQYVLLDDPPYLAPRNREAFVYRFLPDTVLADGAAQAIEVRARPGAGDAQDIRRVRLYRDRRSGQLVALSLHRREGGLLFREESRFYVEIRPVPGGWAPLRTRFSTRLRVPLRTPQQFQTTSTYSDYGEAG